jgi:Kef-type K+ transport system membrane component KefB/Trk K+ transport system NAD-binding subunit
MFSDNAFLEIAVLLGLATLIGLIGQKLRQPLIIMFLVTGIVAGPSYLGILNSYHEIELLANFGIALLLFIVGLKLDLTLIRTTGPVALATGLGQIVFTSLIGYIIAISQGMEMLTSAYVAVALTFSSTIIIVKLLSDKKEIDSLHGQIAIGFLIVQDITAILALIGLTTIGSAGQNADPLMITLQILLKGFGLVLLVVLLMKFVLPNLVKRLAHSMELLTLFAITYAVLFGAGSEFIGFSKEVGAFLAGISLASTEFRNTIGNRLITLRDFLLLFFFIDLGAQLDWSSVGAQLGASFIFSIFVLIGNPLIVLAIMGYMGYRRRTGFLAGLTVAQISEFSLIVAALGFKIGHISNEAVGLITLVGIVTIFLSTYMILYSEKLYFLLSKPLKIFERKNPYREAAIDSLKDEIDAEIMVVGLGNYGKSLAEYLLRRNKKILGVDFDPSILDYWRSQKITVLYGDMSDPEMYEHLPLNKFRWIISTVRSKEMSLALIHYLETKNFQGKIALTAINESEAAIYKTAGANMVLQPFSDATEQAADALTYALDFLPDNVRWPVSFLELRIWSDAIAAGKKIHEIPLRSLTGVSILAVSRGGKINFDPGPGFRIFPSDRLLIMGPPNRIKDAERMLNRTDNKKQNSDPDHFEMAEIKVGENSKLSGHSIADLAFRQKYNVTLIGIRRGNDQITEITPSETIIDGDLLIVIGSSPVIQKLKTREPL